MIMKLQKHLVIVKNGMLYNLVSINTYNKLLKFVYSFRGALCNKWELKLLLLQYSITF